MIGGNLARVSTVFQAPVLFLPLLASTGESGRWFRAILNQ
jgi:hypothetical protein